MCESQVKVSVFTTSATPGHQVLVSQYCHMIIGLKQISYPFLVCMCVYVGGIRTVSDLERECEREVMRHETRVLGDALDGLSI